MASIRTSVAMATYNGDKYIQQQLESLAAQTKLPDEVVICDDGSTDNTIEVIATFQQQAPFALHLYKNAQNLGIAKNFEKALSHCTGEILFLSDQDDVWFPEKIERVIDEFQQHPEALIVINNQLIADANLAHRSVTKLDNILSIGQSYSFFRTGCCTAMRKTLLEVAIPIPDKTIAHDVWINGLAELVGARIVIEDPLQLYRRHGDNNSDWIASRTASVSKWDTLRKHGMGDVIPAWESSISYNRQFTERLEERLSFYRSKGLDGRVTKAIDYYKQIDDYLLTRISLVNIPRWKRIPSIVSALIRGSYANFGGWKSAAKDALR